MCFILVSSHTSWQWLKVFHRLHSVALPHKLQKSSPCHLAGTSFNTSLNDPMIPNDGVQQINSTTALTRQPALLHHPQSSGTDKTSNFTPEQFTARDFQRKDATRTHRVLHGRMVAWSGSMPKNRMASPFQSLAFPASPPFFPQPNKRRGRWSAVSPASTLAHLSCCHPAQQGHWVGPKDKQCDLARAPGQQCVNLT